MTWVSGWRLALLLARREALRAPGRSLLVLVMVTLPVVAVAAADVAQATSSVSAREGLDRRLGASQALVTALPSKGPVQQGVDPQSGDLSTGAEPQTAPTLRQIERALGSRRPVTEVRTRQVGVRTDLGVLRVQASALDLNAPLTRGLYRLSSGRYPAATGEVVINRALAAHGFALGDRITLANGATRRVVGIAESTGLRTTPVLVGPLDSLRPPNRSELRTWLVGGGPVSWAEVRAVNGVRASVYSRYVVTHPPSTDQIPPTVRLVSGRPQMYAVLALIAVMTLIEVVLLAGPAFAVGARRQSRMLALLAANGGSPRQSRRVVLASAVLLGGIGAVVGIAVGILVARLLLPTLQGMQRTYFGPFQVRWTHLAVVAVLGLVSAVLAAAVPAWVASRQDVVAVLAGRRGDRAASRKSPMLGLVLLAISIVAAVLGARQGSGEFVIAGAAVLAVLAMVLLVPVVVVAVARLGRRLPLPLRYAVRDSARHRTRTVPAVAAVAATVAGIVALSIGNSSQQASARAAYQPVMAPGLGAVTVNRPRPDWARVQATVRKVAPGVEQSLVLAAFSGHATISPSVPKQPSVDWMYSSAFGTQILVDPGGSAQPPALLRPWVSGATWARASRVIAAGGALAFTDKPVHADRLRIAAGRVASVVVPAVFVDVGPTHPAPTQAVVSPGLAQRLHVRVRPAGLLLSEQTLSPSQEGALRQALTGLEPSSYLYVERGYQVPGSQKVVLWILFGLGAVLMLGGTLTATFLALSDARPDLATLSAVGASPRMRRGVAAAYALAVGAVGALLGAAVGFIPGVAISYPLTRHLTVTGPSHYLVIPWLSILTLVVALPVLTALIVGLAARSRLPLVARLD